MGIVFDIQRCCYHDGPGIRTTVFLKGCQLRCAWCHNPESFRKEPQLRYMAHRCAACGSCVTACPQGVHSMENGVHRVDFGKCTACGLCVSRCPGEALEILGKEMSPARVMETVLRDRAYYEATGGGVTFSGGEPTVQGAFLLELLRLSREAGLHTCLETNGYISLELLEQLTGLVDLFLLDCKLTHPREQLRYTGASGDLWSRTLHTLQQKDCAVVLRLPVIPGINDTEAHFRAAAALKKSHSCIRELQVMAYHSIGAEKWHQLGYSYGLEGLETVSEEQRVRWQQLLDSL